MATFFCFVVDAEEEKHLSTRVQQYNRLWKMAIENYKPVKERPPLSDKITETLARTWTEIAPTRSRETTLAKAKAFLERKSESPSKGRL